MRSNELIIADRNHLESIKTSFAKNSSIDEKDEKWILKLAQLYKVKADDRAVTKPMLDELWKKVDIIPVSLALAQAAEESGWGTSRFASTGNAIYGQWTWGKDAIIPEKQRKDMGNYGIASFGTLQESVSAYMYNLNTHNAYAGLRKKRAELRTKNQKISGLVLAETLINYSERKEEYVKGLKAMINTNLLVPTDDAYLSSSEAIYLIPAAN